MNDYRKIETSREVYAIIWATHGQDLRAFGGFTDIDGSSPFSNGSPRIETSWHLPNCDFPIVEIITTWDNEIGPGRMSGKRINERHQYFLCVANKE